MSFKLPKLKYGYNALEPYFDSKTMEIHYSRHHATYLKKFNNAIQGTNLEDISLKEIFDNISGLPTAVRNNGGGYLNHILFWQSIGPYKGGEPSGKLGDEITKYFGTFEKFKEEFTKAALNQFGSGWAWLIRKLNGELIVTSSPNQDNPLMDISPIKGKPILALDVWEHAYYLRYQNQRPKYVEAFWNLVNWDAVAELYEEDSIIIEPEKIIE